jgi:hypothetical protein
MRAVFRSTVMLLVLFILPAPLLAAESACPALTTCFTPGGPCTDVIVQALGNAKRAILVQAYRFTSASIAKALLDPRSRGCGPRR